MSNVFSRFLLSGGFNTAVTYLLYILLLFILPYKISYTIAFVTGIALAYILNCWFVFRTTVNQHTLLWFPIIYLIQYLIGIAMVALWVDILNWTPLIAPIAAISVTVPLMFILTQWLFTNIPT